MKQLRPLNLARFEPPLRQLDVWTVFWSNGGVTEDNQMISLSAVSRQIQNGAVAFATMHWSVVLEAQGQSPAAQEALARA